MTTQAINNLKLWILSGMLGMFASAGSTIAVVIWWASRDHNALETLVASEKQTQERLRSLELSNARLEQKLLADNGTVSIKANPLVLTHEFTARPN
jgi:hypothetical protein